MMPLLPGQHRPVAIGGREFPILRYSQANLVLLTPPGPTIDPHRMRILGCAPCPQQSQLGFASSEFNDRSVWAQQGSRVHDE